MSVVALIRDVGAMVKECFSFRSGLVEGKEIEQSGNMTPNDIIDFLEILPADHHLCAEMTIGTFYLASADYNECTNFTGIAH